MSSFFPFLSPDKKGKKELMLPSTPRLIAFDLAGTLIDSRINLCNSINAMLTHFDKPTLPESVIATYIRDRASMLVRRALRDPESDIHHPAHSTPPLTFFLHYYPL